MKVGIIGCGNMGQAFVRALLSKGYLQKKDILCSDKARSKAALVRLRFGVPVTGSNDEVFNSCDVIILALKPQDVDKVFHSRRANKKRLSQATASLGQGKLLISICAGVTTKSLEGYLGKAPIIRVMPNMPAQISQGVSAVSLGKYAKAKHKAVTKSLLSCIGETVEVKEQLIDAVTAISGSGPAYFFYLAEKLIEAAKKMGIACDIAQKLVIKTALGSALLMEQSKESAQILRKRVSSKGGTTEAAFKVFRKKGLDKILSLGFKAAAKRSKELEK
jgi:pyrroline-5-carboxylate reductase